MQPDHKNNFDFLRLFAAISVMFSHSYVLTNNSAQEPLTRLAGNLNCAKLGLYIFFTISGYLVTASMFRNPANYFRNRALRIYPAIIINILIVTFILGALVTTLPIRQYFSCKLLVAYLENMTVLIYAWKLPGVFTNNPVTMVNGSLWTLGQELLLYITIWGLRVSRINYRWAIVTLAIISFLACNAGYTFFGIGNETLQVPIIPNLNISIYFLAGSAFYAFRDKVKYNLAILLFLLVAGVIFYKAGMAYVSLPYAALYVAFNKKIKLQNAGKFGDFSYGLYIYTYPIQQTIIYLNKNQISSLELFAYSLPITLFCAVFSWYLIEKRALRLKCKLG